MSSSLIVRWLSDVAQEDDSVVRRLETEAMRRWLARRRWQRACHMIKATIRLRALGTFSDDVEPEYLSREEEIWL